MNLQVAIMFSLTLFGPNMDSVLHNPFFSKHFKLLVVDRTLFCFYSAVMLFISFFILIIVCIIAVNNTNKATSVVKR